jgi:hypothetical protein
VIYAAVHNNIMSKVIGHLGHLGHLGHSGLLNIQNTENVQTEGIGDRPDISLLVFRIQGKSYDLQFD